MPGTILENLSGKKLSILVGALLVCQIVCFLIGGLIAPTPAGYQYILSTVCLDDSDNSNSTDVWFDSKTCKKIELNKDFQTQGQDIANKLVFAIRMPLLGYDYSRWQQSLVGVLQIEMSWTSEKKTTIDPRKVLTLDARLAYQNKGESTWHHFAAALEQRVMECHISTPKGGFPYVCSTIPLFELGSLHHDYYLLNLRLPVGKQQNKDLDRITDIGLTAIFQNGGFTKVWLGMKTFFFPFIVAIMIWFWRRVHLLSRSPALLEYMLLYLGFALTFLNLPLEYLSLSFDIPFMLLLADIRQGIFYALLLSFWLVFAGEHMLIQDKGEKNTLKIYWKHLSAIVIGCLSLFIFDLCERGVQLRNPFYSIWVTDIGTTLALSFIILAGISACIYFIFLCFMVWKVFCNISQKRTALPTMSRARRLHYEGIIYRFNFLMLATLVCAALTVIWFILGQVAEGQFKWDEHLKLELTSAFFTGVYGMWNIYIFAMLILYAPSHKQWPTDTVNENSVGEEIEFSRLPTDPSPSEISSLTSFARKSTLD